MTEFTGQIRRIAARVHRRLTSTWSLAVRLAIGFSAASFLLLLATAAFPYYALAYNLNREDNESLVEKVASIADIVSRHLSQISSPQDIDELNRAVALEVSEPIFVRVLKWPSGQIVVESPGMDQLVPADRFESPAAYPFDKSTHPSMVDQHRPKHHAMRLLAALLSPKAPANSLEVQVALDRTPEAELLRIYGNCLLGLLIVGLIAAALAGYAIAWRGLRPLRRMAASVARISSSNLHERLSAEKVPPELASLATAFNSMLSRLQLAFDRLSQFSSDIAHELRTPANNIRGLVELTLSQADRPLAERSEQLTNALGECERLTKLIESLLFLARAEHPETQVQRQEFDLRQELNAIYDFYEPLAADAGIKLEVHGESNVRTRANRLLIQRAIANLVENAIAHTPKGGTVTLSATSANEVMVIRVADTGTGIPPEHLSRVFERFYRVDTSRSKNTGGVGLGLAIVRTIALMHGGSADAANRAAGGAEFTITIPDERLAPGPPTAPTPR